MKQQTWILKPGHEILNGKDNDYEWTALVKPGEDVTTGFCSTISTTIWEKHFMPLSVSGLTRQVEELIQTHDYVQAANQPMESNWDLEVTSFAEQIVGLLLNQVEPVELGEE